MPSTSAEPGSSSGIASKLRLKDLQLLLAIDQHKSISAAATSLGVAQPAASRSLMELEKLLRSHLFDRDRSTGMSPTPAGDIVLGHARTILADCSLLQARLEAQRLGVGFHLRLGIIPFAPTDLIGHLMRVLTAAPAQMRITITEASSTQLVHELQMQRLDAALARFTISGVPLAAEISSEVLLRQDACLVVHERCSIALKEELDISDLTRLKWLLPARGTPTRMFIDEAFTSAGITPPTPQIEAGTNRIIHVALKSDRNLVAVVPSDAGTELEKLGDVVALPWRRVPLARPLKFPAIALLFASRYRDAPHIQVLLSELRKAINLPCAAN